MCAPLCSQLERWHLGGSRRSPRDGEIRDLLTTRQADWMHAEATFRNTEEQARMKVWLSPPHHLLPYASPHHLPSPYPTISPITPLLPRSPSHHLLARISTSPFTPISPPHRGTTSPSLATSHSCGLRPLSLYHSLPAVSIA